MSKDTRWKQRFVNFSKAFAQLEKGVSQETYSELEKEGLIQRFEFTFELAWKTLKDYLENKGVECKYPRDVIKEAFHYEILEDGEAWLDMLEKRNLMAHLYEESSAELTFNKIKTEYFVLIQGLFDYLNKHNS